jgi:hypothetical protein
MPDKSTTQPLDIRVTIILDDQPSPEWIAMWRRLLAPLPPTPPPDSAQTEERAEEGDDAQAKK